jgi:hypothetical protein
MTIEPWVAAMPGAGHDHSWAVDMDEVTACCPDLNPALAGTGIRCPGDPSAEVAAHLAADPARAHATPLRRPDLIERDAMVATLRTAAGGSSTLSLSRRSRR